MNEPPQPLEPDSSSNQSTRPTIPRSKLFDLDTNTASFICYIPVCPLNLILGGLFLATEPKAHQFLRFHAMQSLVLGGGYFLFSIAVFILTLGLGVMPFLGFLVGIVNLLSLIVTLVYIGVSIKCMIDAKKGHMDGLPFVGDIARQWI